MRSSPNDSKNFNSFCQDYKVFSQSADLCFDGHGLHNIGLDPEDGNSRIQNSGNCY
jgi:hypothetical protein